MKPEHSENADPSPETRLTRFGLRRYSAAEFLVTLVLMLVATPFVGDIKGGNFIESVLMTIVFLAGMLAVGRRRKTLVIAIILAGPAIFGKWINHLRPDLVPEEVFFTAGLVFAVFLVVQFLLFILRAPRVNSEVVCAGLSLYLMLGLCWMFAYMVLAGINPNAFAFTVGPAAGHVMDKFTAYYFSYVTLSTVGYGDIVPVSKVARMLAAMEAITGTLFIAVLIARLVAIYSSQPPADGTAKPSTGKPLDA
jgi:voltage-gated potassium channel Kch